MIRTIRYSPDTCGCIYDMNYDTDTDQFTLKEVIKACRGHENLSPQAEMDTVMDENRRKNHVVSLMQQVSELTETDTNGNIILKRGQIFYSFTGTAPNRILSIRVVGIAISAQKQAQLIAAIEQRLGINKVVLTIE